jgi:hypothetical protein
MEFESIFLESAACRELSVSQFRMCKGRITLWRITCREEAVAGAEGGGHFVQVGFGEVRLRSEGGAPRSTQVDYLPKFRNGVSFETIWEVHKIKRLHVASVCLTIEL